MLQVHGNHPKYIEILSLKLEGIDVKLLVFGEVGPCIPDVTASSIYTLEDERLEPTNHP